MKQTKLDYICAAMFVAVLVTLPLWLRVLAPYIIALGERMAQ